MSGFDCRWCRLRAVCHRTSYVWLADRKMHGIDRSSCSPELTFIGQLRAVFLGAFGSTDAILRSAHLVCTQFFNEPLRHPLSAIPALVLLPLAFAYEAIEKVRHE